jgi:Uma2 family endonuclease
MTVDTRLMTAEELLEMPDDGMLHELVNGELTTMSPAGEKHGRITMRIAIHLGQYVAAHQLGDVFSSDTGFILTRNPDTVRAPDVPFVSKARALDERGFFPGAPDLAVEVLSPNDRYGEVEEKIVEYLSAGTQVVIVIDPIREIAWIHTSKERIQLAIDDLLEAPDVVPGWSLPLRELFTR